ncbi:MAG: DMT family transporter [Rhodospirillales bacterium]|nr:DMT family transporter [Rhodospirillales bacterium]
MDSSAGSAAATAARESYRRGILWMLVATALFVVTDGMAKYTVNLGIPVPQLMWGYFTFQAVLVLLVKGKNIVAIAAAQRPSMQIFRAFTLLGSTAFFFIGLRFIPLADAGAVFYLAPVIVTALSLPILGERVGPRRWLGVVVAFIGTLIIVRPGSAAMQGGALFPLAGAFFSALFHLMTRLVGKSDGPFTTLFYTAFVGMVVTGMVTPFYWVPLDAEGWVLLIGQGLIVGLGHLAMIRAYGSAPAATIAPFAYSYLVWVTLVSVLVFGDVPDVWTIGGTALIGFSGLYILHREKVRAAASVI